MAPSADRKPAADTPIVSGEMAGIAAVSFRDPLRGMAMGGRVMKHGEHFDNVATCASLHTLTYWTVSNPPPVWVVGQEGRITAFGLQ